jgi:hypothetical protein
MECFRTVGAFADPLAEEPTGRKSIGWTTPPSWMEIPARIKITTLVMIIHHLKISTKTLGTTQTRMEARGATMNLTTFPTASSLLTTIIV